MNLKNKTVIITGGKRVGRAVALALADKGCNIVLTYNSSKEIIEKTIKEIEKKDVKALAMKTDVTNSDDVKKLMKTVYEKFGSVDVLINMASFFPKIRFEDLTEEDFDKNISVDLKGAYLCSLEAAKYFKKNKISKIINFSDWAIDRPYSSYLPYMIAKGGVVTLTKNLAKELAPNVFVNAIAPGQVLLPENIDAKQESHLR
ncbi:MAG: SDR family NAD(P)-dependent oxidoreductase [DPANN group archaeon]|nr:SDR family NAD(P)-dependent oxidoreductase [DPANN group archaeon]